MNTWNFRLNSQPTEILEKLEAELQKLGGFTFEKKGATAFMFRKRALYAWYMAFQNWTVVKGELASKEDATEVNISFGQHFFIKIIVALHLVLGIGFLAVFISSGTSVSDYIPGIMLVFLGVMIWIAGRKKFERDILKYRTLLIQIFELKG